MRHDRSALVRAIMRSATRRREIQAAWLFGSAATGRMRKDSDVDVAVLLTSSPTWISPSLPTVVSCLPSWRAAGFCLLDWRLAWC
jgi:predicted nucleotidyltransferase